MKLAFDSPKTVGTLGNQVTLEQLELITFSFNTRPFERDGSVIMSATMECPRTGHQEHFVFQDADVSFFRKLVELEIDGKPWPQHLIERAQADGKLPAGGIARLTEDPHPSGRGSSRYLLRRLQSLLRRRR